MATTKRSLQRPDKTLPGIHVDDRFLQDHLRDVRAEMSWRRDLEFRLMQFMLIFYPILGTAVVELFKSETFGVPAFAIVALGSVILILIATVVVTDRIDHEHETYVDLGKQVRMIWLYFGLFEKGAYLDGQAFLPEKLLDEKTSLGTGPGYRKTKGLIWFTSATIIVLLLILTAIKVFAL